MYGLTHPGKVRTENQDHFLLCTIHPQVVVHAHCQPPRAAERSSGEGSGVATIMLVADGVGGSAAGSQRQAASPPRPLRATVASAIRGYGTLMAGDDAEFVSTLRDAAIEAHEAVRQEAAAIPEEAGMATTLSLGIVVWPYLYVVQVGDSRCYLYRDGTLRQLTRDQTFAQDLVRQGVFTPQDARNSPLNNVLSSAIGAQEATPEVTRVDVRGRGSVICVCTDGITKHVSDEEIARHLAEMSSAEQVTKALVQLALDRGGSDNITLVVGRAVRRES